MRALVDTQVWLWMLAHPERIGPKATRLLGSEAELLLSAASAWEIAIKYRLGTLELPETPERYVPERMRLTGMTPLPVEHSHALGVATLADHHRDPFDRLLVSQALVEGLPVVTADARLGRYGVDVVAADE
jgi:PIN domain nuclease of toxin-antitoxin system